MGLIQFTMNKDERVTAEAGAMVFTRGNFEVVTRMRQGGFLKSFKVSMVGGESFFINDFIAQEDNSTLGLTGKTFGDIVMIPVKEEFRVSAGTYVASTNELTLDTKWQGFKDGFLGTGLFLLKTIGSGDMFVNGFCGIISIELISGEKMTLDNYQLVAMTSTCSFHVKKHGSLKTALLGGEAFVMEITGPGTVYFQTKNVMESVRALSPFLPSSK